MAAKILNLDSLAKEERILTFDGKSYAVKDMAVEDFIRITQQAEKIEANKDTPLSARIAFLAESIAPSIPDCPKEILMRRSLEELNAIIAFVRDGSLPEGGTEDEEVAESGDEGSAGKKPD